MKLLLQVLRRHALLLSLLAMMSPAPAFAHSMYQAAVLLDFHSQSVDAELQLPCSRIEIALGQSVNASTLQTLQRTLDAYVLARIHVRSNAGEWIVSPSEAASYQVIDGAPYVVVHLRMQPPHGSSVRTLSFEDDVLLDSSPTQVTLVSVRSDWSSSTFANEPELIDVITTDNRSIEIDRSQGSWTRGFRSVFHLGTRHIAEGTDHLLFLFALLLPAPLLWKGGRWAGFAGVRHGSTQILKVVTAFTIGHSLTLALAASGLVNVPSHPIEILIAISILVSAIHAARPLFPGREPLIAGSFGLIHGLAFASTLAELGLHRWERVESIFAFNLGIEAMQLLVVVCVMPSLMLLSRSVLYPAFRTLGACFAGLAAIGWMLDRTFGWSIPVDTVVDGLAKHSLVIAAFLLAMAIAAFYFVPRVPEPAS